MMGAFIEWNLAEILTRVTFTESGCWLWPRWQRDGYALITSRRVSKVAHRFVYELLVGPVPESVELDHICHSQDKNCPGGRACLHRRCVNPKHQEPVTHRENSQRAQSKKTACPQGHPYEGWNLIMKYGRRYCRACTYIRTNAARKKVTA